MPFNAIICEEDVDRVARQRRNSELVCHRSSLSNKICEDMIAVSKEISSFDS